MEFKKKEKKERKKGKSMTEDEEWDSIFIPNFFLIKLNTLYNVQKTKVQNSLELSLEVPFIRNLEKGTLKLNK